MNSKILLSSALIAAIAAGSGMAIAKGGHGGGERGAQFFERLDSDGDGRVTREEMDAHAAERFASADANNDGKLDAEELAAAGEARKAERAQSRVERMLERLDADGDGTLSEAELSSNDRAKSFFDRLDSDGDGAVSTEEFESARADWRGKRGNKRN